MKRLLPITQLGEKVLRTPAKMVRNPKDVRTLAAQMLATMRQARGVGIAANQVGAGLRLFIVAPEPSERYPHAPRLPPILMINPRLINHSKKRVTDWEGCLSIPGMRARVPRWQRIEIEFTTLQGERLRAELTGFVARIFQHEFDHINGRVFLDRVEDTRTFMVESEYQKMWK
jgi:peptide deformylase